MRRIFALIITLSIISCNTDSNTFKIIGNAPGFDDGTELLVYQVNDINQPQVIDTLIVNGGKFEGTYPKSDILTINYLNVASMSGNVLYFPENVDLNATIYKDSIYASKITGSSQNDAYTTFSGKMLEYNDIKQKNSQEFRKAKLEQDGILVQELQNANRALADEEANYKKQFVSDNSNSLFSVMLLTEMVNRKEINTVEAKEIIKSLSPKIAASTTAKTLTSLIKSMKKADVGSVAPDFAAQTPTGETLSLKEAMGEYTIIDFWASWCKPCRVENPNVVRVYNKYHDKGLNIISVSLDKESQKDRWLKAIEKDQLTWSHVSNLKGWKDPIAVQYNVRGIPATFLLDKEGNIIAKNLRGQALENKIASLFN
ncbi:MAG: AhpC/TSA family protein [Flavobacteriaceae bacterium]|nr:AhpC/TSA family protein [Flavobacteriaceae bacterium]